MGEGSAEMNPQFRRLLIKPEAESVPRHGVRVENVSPINKHDITIQPWWKRIDCSDAQEMAESIGRFALKSDKLAEAENKGFIKQFNSWRQIRPDIPEQRASSAQLGLERFISFDQLFWVFAGRIREKPSSR